MITSTQEHRDKMNKGHHTQPKPGVQHGSKSDASMGGAKPTQSMSGTATKKSEKSSDIPGSRRRKKVGWDEEITQRVIVDEQDHGQETSGQRSEGRVSDQKFLESKWKGEAVKGRQQTRLAMLENFFEECRL